MLGRQTLAVDPAVDGIARRTAILGDAFHGHPGLGHRALHRRLVPWHHVVVIRNGRKLSGGAGSGYGAADLDANERVHRAPRQHRQGAVHDPSLFAPVQRAIVGQALAAGGLSRIINQGNEVLEHEEQMVAVARAGLEPPVLAPLSSRVVHGMHQKAADAGNVSRLRRAQQCVLEQCLSQALALMDRIHRQPGQNLHRDRVPSQPVHDSRRRPGP